MQRPTLWTNYSNFFVLGNLKIRLCALNDDSSEESEPEPTQESVKQAKVRKKFILRKVIKAGYITEKKRSDHSTGVIISFRSSQSFLGVLWLSLQKRRAQPV